MVAEEGTPLAKAMSTDTPLERAFLIGGIPRDTMCIDGAATSHMVPHSLQLESNILQNYVPYDEPRKVIVGGNYSG